METPAATAPATTDTTTLAAPASEAATVETTLTTTAAVAAPTASKQCISGSTNNEAALNVPASAEHIHATTVTKWILAIAVGTT